MANAFKTGSQIPNPAPGKDFAMRSSVSHKKIEKWKENLILFSMLEKTRTDACWNAQQFKDNPPQARRENPD
jgi:hypothetical protein